MQFVVQSVSDLGRKAKEKKKVMAGGGGGAPAPKADEPQPHPPKDQLPNVSYCITSPPPWREFDSIFLTLFTSNLILLQS